MAALLIEARDAARDARQAGSAALDPQTLDSLDQPLPGTGRRRTRREPLPQDRDREGRPPDRPPVPEAERTIRPVKAQQRSPGGCWRTIQGLADFAVVQSYLSTAAKWGISKLDALRNLFNGRAWISPALEPAA